MYIYMGDLLKI